MNKKKRNKIYFKISILVFVILSLIFINGIFLNNFNTEKSEINVILEKGKIINNSICLIDKDCSSFGNNSYCVNGNCYFYKVEKGSSSNSKKTKSKSDGFFLNFISASSVGTTLKNIYYNEGNVGIGTINPLSTFHINSSLSAGSFRITNLSSNHLFVNGSTGYVGIGTTKPQGTTNPQSILQVNGTAEIFGSLTIWNYDTDAVSINFRSNTGNLNIYPDNANYSRIILTTDYNLWLAPTGGTLFFGDNDNDGFMSLNGGTYHAYFRAGGVQNAMPADSGILQLDSSGQGFIPPRMTTLQKEAIRSPVAGLIVYDMTINKISYYNGTNWVAP